MRSAFAILLACCIVLSAWKEGMVYVLFKMNQAYIAANVCVNRDVPMSMCSGSCFLEDQLTETQSEDRDIPFSGFENKQSVVLGLPPDAELACCWQQVTSVKPAAHVHWSGLTPISRLFRPPRLTKKG